MNSQDLKAQRSASHHVQSFSLHGLLCILSLFTIIIFCLFFNFIIIFLFFKFNFLMPSGVKCQRAKNTCWNG